MACLLGLDRHPRRTHLRLPGLERHRLQRVEIEAGIAGVRAGGERRPLVQADDLKRHAGLCDSAYGA